MARIPMKEKEIMDATVCKRVNRRTKELEKEIAADLRLGEIQAKENVLTVLGAKAEWDAYVQANDAYERAYSAFERARAAKETAGEARKRALLAVGRKVDKKALRNVGTYSDHYRIDRALDDLIGRRVLDERKVLLAQNPTFQKIDALRKAYDTYHDALWMDGIAGDIKTAYTALMKALA